jgi:hypothetical protein
MGSICIFAAIQKELLFGRVLNVLTGTARSLQGNCRPAGLLLSYRLEFGIPASNNPEPLYRLDWNPMIEILFIYQKY